MRGRDGEGERGWGWQARQTQLALWIEEAIRCVSAERGVQENFWGGERVSPHEACGDDSSSIRPSDNGDKVMAVIG